ncbi:unnamed protein product, partial [Ectocarpus fasciculatus]
GRRLVPLGGWLSVRLHFKLRKRSERCPCAGAKCTRLILRTTWWPQTYVDGEYIGWRVGTNWCTRTAPWQRAECRLLLGVELCAKGLFLCFSRSCCGTTRPRRYPRTRCLVSRCGLRQWLVVVGYFLLVVYHVRVLGSVVPADGPLHSALSLVALSARKNRDELVSQAVVVCSCGRQSVKITGADFIIEARKDRGSFQTRFDGRWPAPELFAVCSTVVV